MSDRKKLEQEWQNRILKGEKVTAVQMVIELGKLAEKCPHDKTRWLQKIGSDGSLSGNLFKKCLLCGFTIDELNAEPAFVEQLLDDFDQKCEEQKVHLNMQTTLVKKQVFCPVCGANLVSQRRFWFRYSPFYVWSSFGALAPVASHGFL